MSGQDIFSGKTFRIDDWVREEVENNLINIAGPYGEMAVSVAFDIAEAQSKMPLMQARMSQESVKIVIKLSAPLNPFRATATTKGASWAMLGTLIKKEVIRIRNTENAVYLTVKVRRVDNKTGVASGFYQPKPVAAYA